MRNLITALSLFLGLAAFAQNAEVESQIRYVTGTGTAYNYCSNNDYFCYSRTRDSARDNAVRDADFQCRMHQGVSDSLGASCSDFCNPAFFPPPGNNNGTTSVSCRADCQIRCQLPDQQNEVAE